MKLSCGKMALMFGVHLTWSVASTSMKAVSRVVLEVIEFSSCRLTGDRRRRDRLERFEATSSFLAVVFVSVSSTCRSNEFRRLRRRLLGGDDDVETVLLTIKDE